MDKQVQENDRNGKEKMKANADKFHHAKEHNILVGDTVLVRQKKKNKWSTRFHREPYCVTRTKGTRVTATRPGHYITRNISCFKKISPQKLNLNTDQEAGKGLDTLDDNNNGMDEINNEDEQNK